MTPPLEPPPGPDAEADVEADVDAEVPTAPSAPARSRRPPPKKSAATKAPAKKAAAEKAAPRKAAAKKVAVKKAPAKAAARPVATRRATSRPRPAPLDIPEPDVEAPVAVPVDLQSAPAGTDEPPRTREMVMPPLPPSTEAPAWHPTASGSAAAPSAPPFTAPRAERKGGGLRSVGIIVGVAVLAGLVIVGLVLGLGKVLGKDGVKYSELKAGDCFERPSGRFKNVTKAACNKPHDLEVYAVLDHPAGAKDAFPGMDELVRYASPLCLAQFKAYAGVPFEQLNLQDVYITPRDSAWKDGARRLVCAVGPQNDQQTSKSIKAG